jgi:hypothetical protein
MLVFAENLERLPESQLVPLRYSCVGLGGFPQGREFRVFVWRGSTILGWGYYWDADDPLTMLTPTEETEVLRLAREAATRLQVPYVAVDVAQPTLRLSFWRALHDRMTTP